jgi:hypothetical protein
MVSRCYQTLTGLQRRWLALFRAVASRDAPAMGALGEELLGTQRELSNEAREYLTLSSVVGYVASGQQAKALAVWDAQKKDLRGAAESPAFRLARCHAERERCAAEFSAYAER